MGNHGIQQPSDQQLLSQISCGNTYALETLMQRYEARVYHFTLKLVKLPHLAEEITQDVFIKIWENRQEMDKLDSIAAWLHRVSRNKALDVLKEAAARYAREDSYAAKENLVLDGENDIHFKDFRHLLEGFVDELPAKRKEILRLKMEKGWTNEEIGLHLNISTNTVNNQLSKSYLSLRQRLSKHVYLLLLGTLLP